MIPTTAMSTDPTPTPPTGHQIRVLDPTSLTLGIGQHGQIICSLAGDPTTYAGLFAVRLFPISHPEGFISLRHTGEDDKEREIGVVESLDGLAPRDRQLVETSLARQYHESEIRRVLDIRSEFGLLFFRVETARGPGEFVMPWRQDRAEDYGLTGKVLLDSVGNRHVVRDVAALPEKDRALFQKFVYW